MKLHRYGKSIEKLGQRYRLDGHLGAGGMADICLAWDEKSQRKVAIKVIKSQNIDPDTLNRFVHEGSLVKGWQHPHIIQVYDDIRLELLDASTGSTIPYLVMEYITEGTLQERLVADRPYPFPNTITIFAQLCNALQYAHDHHVIHRDLKPSNILFKTPRGTNDFITLSDFGMAVSMNAQDHTFPHGGTPLYMAPEQSRGQTVQASDIFALGVILYRLCTGQMPFQLPDLYEKEKPLPIPALPSTINTALPKDLDQVILTALSENPLQRHATARLFWQHFQDAITPAITEIQKRTTAVHSITLPPANQIPAQEKIAPPITTPEPAQSPATPATNPEPAQPPNIPAILQTNAAQPALINPNTPNLLTTTPLPQNPSTGFALQQHFPVDSSLENYTKGLREQDNALLSVDANAAKKGFWPFGRQKNSASSPADGAVPYPEEDEEEFYDEDEEPIQQNPRMMSPLRRSHVQPEELLDEEDNRHIGPALAAGATAGFALADLSNNPHRSEPPSSALVAGVTQVSDAPNQPQGGATQAIDLDDDDYALPPADKGGAAIPIQSSTNVPGPAPVASASRQVPLPVTPPESEESPASDAGADGIAAGPAMIDLSQRKPRTTAQLPPRTPEQQPVPPRTQRRNSPFAGGAAAGAMGAAAFGASQSPPAVTPARTPPTTPPPRRPRRWVWGILLLLLTFPIVCMSLLYVQPRLFSGISAVNILPGSTPPVTLTIVPASQIVSNSYVITGVAGTPDPKQQTIKALTLNGTAQSQTLTVNATGHNQTVGKAATGTLTFFNENPVAITIKAHTVFTASNGVQLWNNTAVTIAAANLPTVSSQDVVATVLSVGISGNIGAGVINESCCAAGIAVKNASAFTGGVDPANYNFVTQSDIDAVQNQVAQQAVNQFKGKLAAGEQFAQSPQCQTSVTSSSPVGDHHQNVATTSVTISATCDSVAYDDQGMRALVTQLLTQKAQVSPGARYILQGNRISIDPKIQSLDPFSLNVNAKGQWVYQIGDQQRSEIIQLIGGKSVEAAMVALKGYTGIASSTIQFSGTALPTDPNQYASSFVINAPAPLPAN